MKIEYVCLHCNQMCKEVQSSGENEQGEIETKTFYVCKNTACPIFDVLRPEEHVKRIERVI